MSFGNLIKNEKFFVVKMLSDPILAPSNHPILFWIFVSLITLSWSLDAINQQIYHSIFFPFVKIKDTFFLQLHSSSNFPLSSWRLKHPQMFTRSHHEPLLDVLGCDLPGPWEVRAPKLAGSALGHRLLGFLSQACSALFSLREFFSS